MRSVETNSSIPPQNPENLRILRFKIPLLSTLEVHEKCLFPSRHSDTNPHSARREQLEAILTPRDLKMFFRESKKYVVPQCWRSSGIWHFFGFVIFHF
jgi:hypothetical protein